MPNRSSLAQMFRINPNAFPGTNPGAFNDEFNQSIPESVERQRETGVLEGMDARADAANARDLEEAEQTRSLRGMGFQGPHPAREAADYSAQQKLMQLLAPKQMELAAAQENRQATQTFQAGQNDLARQASADQNQSRIAAANERQQTGIQAAQTMARDKGQIQGPGWWDSLMGGEDAETAATEEAAAPVAPKIKSIRQVR